MSIIKKIEDIIRIRDELYEVEKKVEHLRREMDGTAAELLGFLKEKGLIQTREI
jgi:hypothetical protein